MGWVCHEGSSGTNQRKCGNCSVSWGQTQTPVCYLNSIVSQFIMLPRSTAAWCLLREPLNLLIGRVICQETRVKAFSCCSSWERKQSEISDMTWGENVWVSLQIQIANVCIISHDVFSCEHLITFTKCPNLIYSKCIIIYYNFCRYCITTLAVDL